MIQKHTFPTFAEAVDFLECKRREGHEGIYYPEGGDNLRRMTTDAPRHIVLIIPAPIPTEEK